MSDNNDFATARTLRLPKLGPKFVRHIYDTALENVSTFFFKKIILLYPSKRCDFKGTGIVCHDEY